MTQEHYNIRTLYCSPEGRTTTPLPFAFSARNLAPSGLIEQTRLTTKINKIKTTAETMMFIYTSESSETVELYTRIKIMLEES